MLVIATQFFRAKSKAVSVYFTSKQILPFGFSGQTFNPCTLNTLDLFHDTMYVQSHFTVYYSGECWRSWPKNVPSLGLLQVFKLTFFLQRKTLDTDNLFMHSICFAK